MIDVKALNAFVAIIEQQSFEKAANTLFITQSAVSQRLKNLEESLGQTLIVRSPQIKATQAGQALLKYAQNLAQLDRSLHKELAPRKQQGWIKISIATNADTLSTWLLSALAPWCLEQKVLLDLKVDDQDKTHEYLKNGKVLGCISSIEKISPGYTCTSLGNIEYHCIASPYFKKKYFDKGVTRERMRKAPTVIFDNKDLLLHQYLKQYFDLDADQQLQHFIPSSESYLEWIKLGMGFGMVPKQQMQKLLDNGELVLLTPDYKISVPLFWQRWGINTELGKSLSQQIIKHANIAHT